MLNIDYWSDRKEMENCIKTNSRLGDLGVMPFVQWKNKEDKAIFRGAQSGDFNDTDGNLVGRGKLMQLSIENEEILEVWFSKFEKDYKNYTKTLPKNKLREYSLPLCEDLDYKYAIAIDGNIAGWQRGPLLLLSNMVPLIVESKYKPLYLDSWIPWVHYVPIKNDLSDLIETINWLIDHDDAAYQIAQNGKALYHKLYNPQKMIDDSVLVFKKYAELTKYEPDVPNSR